MVLLRNDERVALSQSVTTTNPYRDQSLDGAHLRSGEGVEDGDHVLILGTSSENRAV